MSPPREQRTSARLFFALLPPLAVQTRLAILARGIAERTQGRAVEAANLHLTLAFLGEVDLARESALLALAQELPRASFELELSSLGMFRNANMAWIAPREVPAQLSTLQQALQRQLASGAFRVEERTFRPHMTLARRCSNPLPRQAIAPIVWNVRAFALMESQMGGARIRYVKRASFALGER